MRLWIIKMAAICLLAGVASAQEAIVAIEVAPKKSVAKDSGWNKPLVLKSSEDAAKHFDKEALREVTKAVDFKKQFVLVFAWHGSGGDTLSYNVMESFPEQIIFMRKPGKTKDLRFHAKIYALRANVRWRAAGAK